MTNRNMNMNRRTAERATERARIITARKKASAKKKRIIVSVVALVLVLVAGASAVIVGVTNNHAKPAAAKPLVTTTTAAPKAENRPVSQLSEKAAEHEEHIPEEENENAAPETNETPEYNEQPKDENNNNNEAAAENATQPQEQDKIEVVNGDRIYIDTKRQAPAVTGTPLHFYANGKTSYGFDWDYNTDNANFVLRCDYNFNAQQYDFQFYGVTPGTANVTLYYFTADGVKIPVNMTINVDNDLNVTQA